MSAEHRLPVLIVSGFLGSGKTTLLRTFLRSPLAGEVAIIVNEFGEVGIDHHLIRTTDEQTVLLARGCVCCSMRSDLAHALRDLLSKRERGVIPRFDRVVIETTGLADPVPIVQTIVSDPVVRHHFRVECLAVTLDAVTGADNLASYGEAVRQVAAADVVVVTKQDLADAGAVAALKAALTAINPAALVLDGAFGHTDFARLLSADRSDFRAVGEFGAGGGNGANGWALPATAHGAGAVSSRCIEFDRPLDWHMFGVWLTMLLHRHGSRILRLKGLLNVGADGGPLVLEGVQHVIHAPRHLRAWPDADRRSRIIVIARDLDIDLIEASLHAFQDAAKSA
ncbi:MAG: GTP-binding protein [Sphaerobacter sp.]|nr:GTP-binding protein [Sphaerobacter sp.]